VIRIAYFGLPLAALLLSSDGFEPALAALSPIAAPGNRRLRRRLGDRVIDAQSVTRDELDVAVDARLESLDVDLLVSWYWTRRIPARWLARARLGAIGAHPSLLPRHRGPDPFFWAIDSGDAVTGVSVHFLTELYDEGAVVCAESLEIGDRNAWELARALDRPSLRLIRSAVREFASGATPRAIPQDDALATWAPAPTGELLRADFRSGSERVLRRVRALAPDPGLGLEIFGIRFTVLRAEPTTDFPLALEPGEAAVGESGVAVRTSDGAVRITRARIEDSDEVEPEIVDARALSALLSRKRQPD
jgi:methionyl-tRNA formyltransferase